MTTQRYAKDLGAGFLENLPCEPGLQRVRKWPVGAPPTAVVAAGTVSQDPPHHTGANAAATQG
ncbi:MAG: hypothetical protein JWQ29_1691 [Phenylobacterium sp.]|nr:hypothetical protein [Phenylobacterium sp.]